jgi:hypothetical protein
VKRFSKQATAFAVLAVSIFAVPSGNTAFASKSNCSSVRNIYPFGIALNKPSIGTSRAEVNRKKYIQFKYLDKDLDGIVCEIEKLQTVVTTPVSTSVTVPSTIVTLPMYVPVPSTIVTLPKYVPVPRTTNSYVPVPRSTITIPPRLSRPCVFPYLGPSNSNCLPGQIDTTTTTAATTTTTTTTTTVYQQIVTPVGLPVKISNGLVVTVSNLTQEDPGKMYNFFYLNFDVTATYPADSASTLTYLSIPYVFNLGCKSIPLVPHQGWYFGLHGSTALDPLEIGEILGRVRKGASQRIRISLLRSTEDEAKGIKIDWSNYRYLAFGSPAGWCPDPNFRDPIYELPFVLNPKQ